MQEEKITLDREAFRALASGSRVGILKSLDARRKTLTELSKQFGMSASTVKEHMDNLSSVGLVVQKDEGHKWKYYELTRKGRKILHPEETKIWIMLSVSVLAMAGITYDLLSRFYFSSYATNEMLAAGASDSFVQSAPKAMQVAAELPWLQIAGLAIFGVILGVTIGYFLTRKGDWDIYKPDR